MDTKTTTAEREKRITDNLDLSKIIYRRIAESALAVREHDDLISEGNLALCMAANSWTPDMKASFRTYASRCIEKRMLGYLKKEFAYHNVFTPLSEILEKEDRL